MTIKTLDIDIIVIYLFIIIFVHKNILRTMKINFILQQSTSGILKLLGWRGGRKRNVSNIFVVLQVRGHK